MHELQSELQIEPRPERRPAIVERNVVDLQRVSVGIRLVAGRDGAVKQRVAGPLQIEKPDGKPHRLIVIIAALEIETAQMIVAIAGEAERLARRQILVLDDVAGLHRETVAGAEEL